MSTSIFDFPSAIAYQNATGKNIIERGKAFKADMDTMLQSAKITLEEYQNIFPTEEMDDALIAKFKNAHTNYYN